MEGMTRLCLVRSWQKVMIQMQSNRFRYTRNYKDAYCMAISFMS